MAHSAKCSCHIANKAKLLSCGRSPELYLCACVCVYSGAVGGGVSTSQRLWPSLYRCQQSVPWWEHWQQPYWVQLIRLPRRSKNFLRSFTPVRLTQTADIRCAALCNHTHTQTNLGCVALYVLLPLSGCKKKSSAKRIKKQQKERKRLRTLYVARALFRLQRRCVHCTFNCLPYIFSRTVCARLLYSFCFCYCSLCCAVRMPLCIAVNFTFPFLISISLRVYLPFGHSLNGRRHSQCCHNCTKTKKI